MPSTVIGASMQFASAFIWGNRLKCWNTMPILAGARQDRHGVPAFQPVPPYERARELHRGANDGARHETPGGGRARSGTPRFGWLGRQEGSLSGTAIRRPATACCNRPRARHAAEGDVV